MEGHMDDLRRPAGLPGPHSFRLAVLKKFREAQHCADDYRRYCLTWSFYEDSNEYAALLQVDPG